VVAPVPYQAPGRKRKYYRDPAFLLTTDLTGTPQELLQAYFDGWQIEVNHREELNHREEKRYPRCGSGAGPVETFGAATARFCPGFLQRAPCGGTFNLGSGPR
jgi:hypothetical protein